MDSPQLLLKNQICFPIHASSRLITQMYQPYLQPLGITYPQYLVFLLLWEEDKRIISDIGKCLLLESNTLSPLLKRLEAKKYIERKRILNDERQVEISLTQQGKDLKEKCKDIPLKIIKDFNPKNLTLKDLENLKLILDKIINNSIAKTEKETDI
jgi:DNA-binding MarR family transcriptional regulator